jgi:two-component system, LuxR family, response regulator FixJ
VSKPKPTYIVDDDAAVRESMSVLLEAQDLPVRCFASAEEFLLAAPSLELGCVVSDIRMPGIGGIELIDKLAASGLHFPVIVMTAYGEVPLAVRALKAGAVDYIEKPFPGSALIHAVLSSLKSIDTAPDRSAEPHAFAERLRSLTVREREVMDALIKGRQNKEIADTLGMSFTTVEVHRARLMGKMQARSLAALVRMAVAAGQEI